MGLFDWLGLRGYKRPKIQVEGVVGAWSAARTAAGISLAGGEVVLARDLLIFSPWDMDKTREWLAEVLPELSQAAEVGETLGGYPPGTAAAVKLGVRAFQRLDKLIDESQILEPVVLAVGDISNVEVLNCASVFKPPQARLHLKDGRHLDLGILKSPRTPNFSRKNNVAFNDWLAEIRLAIRG